MLKNLKKTLFLYMLISIATLISCKGIKAQDSLVLQTTVLHKNTLAVGVQVPWEILWGPDDYIWATERRGQVLRINPENGNIQSILDIDNKVTGDGNDGEPGMLGMALHPDFADTPTVFIVYNYDLGFNTYERLVQYTWNGTNLVNEKILIDQIPGGGIHNGSRLLITPDHKLLMTTGDTGNSSLAQSDNSLMGKILRINFDGTIPADNPSPTSYIYTKGHRNPQGLTYGKNGILYSSEHGAQQSDEFNIIEVSRNYGWPTVQGACNTTTEQLFCTQYNVKEPLKEWTPCVAVNGLEYYNHPAIPEWDNCMLMAVLGGLGGLYPRVSVLKLSIDGQTIQSEEEYFDNFGRIRDLCVNPYTGAIYIATNGASYPGYGPNEIIEYKNKSYEPLNAKPTPKPETDTQFIKLLPNVLKNSADIYFSDNFIGNTYQIINYNKQVVKTEPIHNSHIILYKDQLPAGSYYIKATNNKGTITKKFVVE